MASFIREDQMEICQALPKLLRAAGIKCFKMRNARCQICTTKPWVNPTSPSWGDKYEVCPRPKTGPPPPSPQDVGILAQSWDLRDPPFCGLNFASTTRHWTRDLWEESIKILPRVEVWAETIWNRRRDSDHCRQSTCHVLISSKLLVH